MREGIGWSNSTPPCREILESVRVRSGFAMVFVWGQPTKFMKMMTFLPYGFPIQTETDCTGSRFGHDVSANQHSGYFSFVSSPVVMFGFGWPVVGNIIIWVALCIRQLRVCRWSSLTTPPNLGTA
jgi:hypothetical protein